MGAAVSSQPQGHAHSSPRSSRASLSLSSLLNQLRASPISPLLDQALAVGHYALPTSVVSVLQSRSLEGTHSEDEGQQTDCSSAQTSREGSIRHQESSSCSSAGSSATNSPESQRRGMSRRAGRDLTCDETGDGDESARVYGDGSEEENTLGLMMGMVVEQRPEGDAARQEPPSAPSPSEKEDGRSPASTSTETVQVQRWLVIDEQDVAGALDATFPTSTASVNAPSLHPFDPTFSPPSPLCGSSSPISATSSAPTSALSNSRPPPTPPTPSPPRSLPQLPEGCVLIPYIAEEDTEEEDAEYWTRLPTFEQGPGSPNWNWADSSSSSSDQPAPTAPPSPRSRSLSLPLPLKERPTAPSRARSSPSSSTLLALSGSSSGNSPDSRGRSNSPSSRGRDFSPCASTSRSPSPSPPKEPAPAMTESARRRRTRRPKPVAVVDPWAPASPPEEKKKYMRSIGSALEGSDDSEEDEGEESGSEEEDGEESDDDEEEEEDQRFVDLAQLRRVHYLSLSLQAPPSSSASSSRSNSPDGSAPRRRQKRGSLFFAEQWRLYALGTANLRRTGEGYWRDVGRGGGWFDLE